MRIEKRLSKKGYRYRVRVAIQGYPLKTKTFAKKSEAVDWGRSHEADLSGVSSGPRNLLGSPCQRQFRDSKKNDLQAMVNGFWIGETLESSSGGMRKWGNSTSTS